jgi:hypothetical protein
VDGSPRDASPRSPARGTTPGSRTRDKKKKKKTPDRHPAGSARRSAARGGRLLWGGARRAAPQSSHGTFPFYWNIPVLSELTGSTRSEKCCRNLRVLAEPKRTLYAYVVRGPRPRRPGRRHRTSFDGLGTRTRYKDRVLAGRDAVTVPRSTDSVRERGTRTASSPAGTPSPYSVPAKTRSPYAVR